MPHASTPPPSDRFFARLDKFEAECPNCGKLIYSAMTRRHRTVPEGRARGRLGPKGRRIWDHVWNPVTQRVQCPWCAKSYMAGLILHPVPPGQKRPIDPPPDVIPDARELAAIRQRAGGWWATRTYQRGEPVNVAVATPCTCPARGWSTSCAVHGDPSFPVEGGNSELLEGKSHPL